MSADCSTKPEARAALATIPDPKHALRPLVLVSLGAALLAQGKVDDALAALRKAQGIKPEEQRAYEIEFDLLIGQRKFDEAGKTVDALARTNADQTYGEMTRVRLDVAKAREVPRWRESDVFTPLERDVMEYAEAMTRTPPTVTDGLSARLLEALGPAALVELTMYIALANLYTRSNTAIGIESQEFSAACDLKPLASPGGVASRT